MKLFGPKAGDSRPIIDRVKEALFSVLYKYDLPAGKVVADVFSGVGSLGLEALSRGAGFVNFVEKDPRVVAVLEKNIAKAGFAARSRVITANAFRIGAPAAPDGRKCDLVFIDPPYADTADVSPGSALAGVLALVCEQMAAGGFAVVRTRRGVELLERYARFKVTERRQWGTMAVTILQREQDDEETSGGKHN